MDSQSAVHCGDRRDEFGRLDGHDASLTCEMSEMSVEEESISDIGSDSDEIMDADVMLDAEEFVKECIAILCEY